MTNSRAVMFRLLAGFCFVASMSSAVAYAQDVVIDWSKKQIQTAPAEINSSRRVTVTVINVNDMLYTYSASITAVPRQVSDADSIVSLLNNLASGSNSIRSRGEVDCSTWTKLIGDLQSKIEAILNAPSAGKTSDGKVCKGYCSVSLTETTTKWIADVRSQLPNLQMLIASPPTGCVDAAQLTALQDLLSRVTNFDTRLMSANHQVTVDTAFSPDNDYRIEITEFYNSQTTDDGLRDFVISPSSTVLSLSLGPIFSMVPNRTYSIQQAPVTPGSTMTQSVLSVTGGKVTPYVAALLNYRLPFGWIFKDHPLNVTSGPVIRVESSQGGATSIGYFAGISFTLFNRLFLTPGAHVGQFSDFPQGLSYPGQLVPPTITSLTPLNRWSVRFAFGISYKTKDFSKVGGQPQLSNPMPTPTPGATVTPTIASLSSTSGRVGSMVTITGTNFGPMQGANTVTFAGVLAAMATSWSPTSIVVTVPATATTGNVVVTVGGQASNGITFTVTPAGAAAPSITSLSVTSGAVGSTVTITGTNFGAATQADSTVTFAGVPATATNWSPTSIVVTVPATTTGNVVVTIGGQASNGITFTVTPAGAAAPSITSLSVTSGAVGSTVTITGTSFGATQADSTVTFAGVPAAMATSWSPTSIVVTVPATATTGNVVVTVGGQNSNAVQFTVTPPLRAAAPGIVNLPVTL